MGEFKTGRGLRALAIVAPLAGMAASLVAVAMLWSRPPQATLIHDTMGAIGGVLVLAMALLIA